MGKYIKAITLLFCLLFATNAESVSPVILHGMSSGSSCPSYYASAILSMNFENGLNACDSSGNEVLFTGSGAEIGAYGETGQGLRVNDEGEDITKSQADQEYVNEHANQTLCAKVKISAQLDNAVGIIRFRDSGYDDQITLAINSASPAVLIGYYDTDGAGNDYSGTGTGLVVDTWQTVAYSWQGGTVPNGDIWVDPGDGGGWEESDSVIDVAMTTAITQIQIGAIWGDPDSADAEYIYIDEWALVGSYKFDCSTLF